MNVSNLAGVELAMRRAQLCGYVYIQDRDGGTLNVPTGDAAAEDTCGHEKGSQRKGKGTCLVQHAFLYEASALRGPAGNTVTRSSARRC